MILAVRNLNIIFPERTLFKECNLDVFEDDFIVITSGVMDGATTFIKSLVALIDNTQGEIIFEGHDILKLNSHKKRQDARKKIGLVYEARGLISIMNVSQNIALPLSYHTNLNKSEIKERIDYLANDLMIMDLLHLEPNELNDTQTRIVNLARALIVEPRLLLVDELEGGMSEEVMDHMIDVILTYQKQFHFGIVMTTLGKNVSFATTHYSIRDHRLHEVNNA